MHVWAGVDDIPEGLGPTSVTVGTFDGVHRGHRVLLDRVVADAPKGLLPVAVTFDPHPMSVVRPERVPPMLTTVVQRLELFERFGIQGVLVVPFTPARAAQPAAEFATSVLVDGLAARHVIVGCNFRFGNRAAGDVSLLEDLGRSFGFDVTSVELEPLAGGGAVSSTVIRSMIGQGDVAGAAEALGHTFRLSGRVVTGDRRGRDLGFPTANLEVPAGMAIPADGVYAGRFHVPAHSAAWRPAAISVGTNPTFDGQVRRIEAYVLDAPAGYDVYGHRADVEFVDHIRPMARFDSTDALVAQMTADVARSREILGV